MASCCYWLFCCCSGPAVVNIHSASGVTTDVLVPSDFGFATATGVPFLFSIHAVVWHFAFETSGKFAAAGAVAVDTVANLRWSTTPAANLPLVSLTPVANLSLVSLTPLVHLDLQIFEQKLPQFYNQGPGGR